MLFGCCQKDTCTTDEKQDQPNISNSMIKKITESLISKHGKNVEDRITRGVKHVASLWRTSDGNEIEFEIFCAEKFIANQKELNIFFEKVSRNIEILNGHFNKISLDLQRPLHEPMGNIFTIDEMFGGYSAGSHLIEDMYRNKLAFYIALNFPYYNLKDKEKLGKSWTRQEWAFARLGDMFTARIPSELLQKASEIGSASEMYIARYNIHMGHLTNSSGDQFFPEEMVLLSHWNLRDEIKANYSKAEKGLDKQAMIYEVMKRIIAQTIPQRVINSDAYEWDPYTNLVYQNGQTIESSPEPDERYQQILNNFHAMKAMDAYSPLNTAIRRAFEGGMEITQPDAEKLFKKFLSSKELEKVGELISQRLGRDLKPWDIWYDGFKARSSINEESLNAITQSRYPDAAALKKDLPRMLMTLGFTPEKANYLAEKIDVDAARGSGHAWGASMRGEKAHLRTRIPESGMNYKGYNIAVHEFGHNVEQTTSLYDVDYYMLNGVPNTAFTEALAFIFQKRDLELLGISDKNPQKEALQILDNFWSTYEIMGVSLLDQRMWKWMYANPNATAAELKVAVDTIAKEIWNEYYAPVFGIKDEPILAIYSHMVNSPIYLSNYAFGHLIQFQVEQYLQSTDFAKEVERIYRLGTLTPNTWMKEAVGEEISIDSIIKKTGKAVKIVKKG
ncbi:hypothetical protein DMA11_13195 [Marinilabiliaceae bacterium JC017]|nr:hypothetical protein DMA11_13195 [Marinilabiliaceae bacterium JC017]